MPISDWSSQLKQVLIEPFVFFDGRSADLGVAARVVALVALAQAGLSVAIVLIIGAQLSLLQEGGIGEPILSVVIGVFFLVFLNWLVVSGVLHVIIKLRHGNGTFGDTMYVVGWSAPAALLLVVFAGGAAFAATLGIDSSQLLNTQVEDITQAANVGAIFGSLVALGWQAQIWRAGLRELHDPPREAPMQAAFITAAIGFLAVLFNAF